MGGGCGSLSIGRMHACEQVNLKDRGIMYIRCNKVGFEYMSSFFLVVYIGLLSPSFERERRTTATYIYTLL